MTNACCIKQTIVRGGCQAAEGGRWGDHAASFGVFGHLCGRPPACTHRPPALPAWAGEGALWVSEGFWAPRGHKCLDSLFLWS